MEKFQIAKYGLMQVVAIVYGIMVCGAGVRLNRGLIERGVPMPYVYYVTLFVRDYGFLLLGLVILWVAAASYFSSTLAPRQFDEDVLAYSGLILAILFALATTIIAGWAVDVAFGQTV